MVEGYIAATMYLTVATYEAPQPVYNQLSIIPIIVETAPNRDPACRSLYHACTHTPRG